MADLCVSFCLIPTKMAMVFLMIVPSTLTPPACSAAEVLHFDRPCHLHRDPYRGSHIFPKWSGLKSKKNRQVLHLCGMLNITSTPCPQSGRDNCLDLGFFSASRSSKPYLVVWIFGFGFEWVLGFRG